MKPHLATSVRLLVALVAAISITLLVVHGLQMRFDKNREAEQVQADLHNIARAMAGQTRQTLGTVDQSVRWIASGMDMTQPASVVHQTLRTARDATIGVTEFFFVDATGKVAAASYDPSPEPVDLSGEQPFAVPPAGPETAPRISPPLVARLGQAAGAQIIRLARPRIGPQGVLEGWAVGTISIEHFHTLFESMIARPRTSIALFRDDGVLLSGSGEASSAFSPQRSAAQRSAAQRCSRTALPTATQRGGSGPAAPAPPASGPWRSFPGL